MLYTAKAPFRAPPPPPISGGGGGGGRGAFGIMAPADLLLIIQSPNEAYNPGL